MWNKSVEVTEQILHTDETVSERASQLSSLNLAHNLFTSIPVVLPCLAVNLTRLNLAFNSLRSMSHVTSYPNSLKQLDLSHNQISVWPSLPQIETQDNMELAHLACYVTNSNFRGKYFDSASINYTNGFWKRVINYYLFQCKGDRVDRSDILFYIPCVVIVDI